MFSSPNPHRKVQKRSQVTLLRHRHVTSAKWTKKQLQQRLTRQQEHETREIATTLHNPPHYPTKSRSIPSQRSPTMHSSISAVQFHPHSSSQSAILWPFSPLFDHSSSQIQSLTDNNAQHVPFSGPTQYPTLYQHQYQHEAGFKQTGSDADFDHAMNIYNHVDVISKTYTYRGLHQGVMDFQQGGVPDPVSFFTRRAAPLLSPQDATQQQSQFNQQINQHRGLGQSATIAPSPGSSLSPSSHQLKKSTPATASEPQEPLIDWFHDFHAEANPLYLSALITPTTTNQHNSNAGNPTAVASSVDSSRNETRWNPPAGQTKVANHTPTHSEQDTTSISASPSPPLHPILQSFISLQQSQVTPPIDDATTFTTNLTPAQIVSHLDNFIIGQHEAKRTVAVALRNRYRLSKLPLAQRQHIMPKNLLLHGPTGSGKTQIARILGKMSNSPLFHANMTQYTETGYVGKSVDSIVGDLVQAAIQSIKDQHGLVIQAEAEDNAAWALTMKFDLNYADLDWIVKKIEGYKGLMEPGGHFEKPPRQLGGDSSPTFPSLIQKMNQGGNNWPHTTGNNKGMDQHKMLSSVSRTVNDPKSIVDSIVAQFPLPPFIQAENQQVDNLPEIKRKIRLESNAASLFSSQPHINQNSDQALSPSQSEPHFDPTNHASFQLDHSIVSSHCYPHPWPGVRPRNNQSQSYSSSSPHHTKQHDLRDDNEMQQEQSAVSGSGSTIQSTQLHSNGQYNNNQHTQGVDNLLSSHHKTTSTPPQMAVSGTTKPTYFHLSSSSISSNPGRSPSSSKASNDKMRELRMNPKEVGPPTSHHLLYPQPDPNNMLSIPIYKNYVIPSPDAHNSGNCATDIEGDLSYNHPPRNDSSQITATMSTNNNIQDLFTLLQLPSNQNKSEGDDGQGGKIKAENKTTNLDSPFNPHLSPTNDKHQSLDDVFKQQLLHLVEQSNKKPPKPHLFDAIIPSQLRDVLMQLHFISPSDHSTKGISVEFETLLASLQKETEPTPSSSSTTPQPSAIPSPPVTMSAQSAPKQPTDSVQASSRFQQPQQISLEQAKNNVFLSWVKHFIKKGVFDNHLISLSLPLYALSQKSQQLVTQLDMTQIECKTHLDGIADGQSQSKIGEHERHLRNNQRMVALPNQPLPDKPANQSNETLPPPSQSVTTKTVTTTINGAKKLFALMETERLSMRSQSQWSQNNTVPLSSSPVTHYGIGQYQHPQSQQQISPDLVQKAIHLAQTSGIIILDEIDKLITPPHCKSSHGLSSGGGGGGEASAEGVAKDLLPILGGCAVQTNHGPIDTTNILFIAAGAFSDVDPNNLLPELSGRLPLRVGLKALNVVDYWAILTQTENSLLRQSVQLFAQEGIALRFTNDAVWEMAKLTQEMNQTQQNTGARRLNSVVEGILEDANFYLADITTDAVLVINQSYVARKGQELIKRNSDGVKFDSFVL